MQQHSRSPIGKSGHAEFGRKKMTVYYFHPVFVNDLDLSLKLHCFKHNDNKTQQKVFHAGHGIFFLNCTASRHGCNLLWVTINNITSFSEIMCHCWEIAIRWHLYGYIFHCRHQEWLWSRWMESEGCSYTVAIPKRYRKMKSTGHGRKAVSTLLALLSIWKQTFCTSWEVPRRRAAPGQAELTNLPQSLNEREIDQYIAEPPPVEPPVGAAHMTDTDSQKQRLQPPWRG